MTEILYVSWGGSGRGTAVRAAVERARDEDVSLGFLAVLDESFGDMDEALADVVADELGWLVSAQMRMVTAALNAENVRTRVLVRRGPLLEIVPAAVKESTVDLVLLGAPVPLDGAAIERLEDATGVPVEVIGPEQAEA